MQKKKKIENKNRTTSALTFLKKVFFFVFKFFCFAVITLVLYWNFRLQKEMKQEQQHQQHQQQQQQQQQQ